jgi:hypothetical protein
VTDVDERLHDLVRHVADVVEVPDFARLASRARRRGRLRLAAGCLGLVLAAVGLAAVLHPDTEATGPLPATTKSPSSSPSTTMASDVPLSQRGELTDVAVLPGGRVILLYAACPAKEALCIPHSFQSRDHGATWSARRDFDDPEFAVEGSKAFDVSAAGDVALLADEVIDSAQTTGAAASLVGATMSYDDRGMNWSIVRQGATVSPADLRDASRAIVTAVVSYQVVAQGLSDLIVAPLRGHPSGDFSYRGAADGVLTGKVEGHDAVSTDLGATWKPIPDLDETGYRTSVFQPRPHQLVRFGFADVTGAGSLGYYPLSHIQTSTDNGDTWSTRSVGGPRSQPVQTVVPLANGSYIATTPDGRLVTSTDGRTFARSSDVPGRLASVGGHNGYAWAFTTEGKLWVSLKAAQPAWQEIPLPE